MTAIYSHRHSSTHTPWYIVARVMATFPPSSIVELNRATHNAQWDSVRGEWSIVIDAARFHVFIVVALPTRDVRIDWRQTSRLEVEPYVATPGEERVRLGRREGFCRPCLVHMLQSYMKRYSLFAFNCRTVTYLIATEVCGFEPATVFGVFETRDMLCGLGEPLACLTLEEMHHYVEAQRLERELGAV